MYLNPGQKMWIEGERNRTMIKGGERRRTWNCKHKRKDLS